jgi:Tol biopolymer transport system component
MNRFTLLAAGITFAGLAHAAAPAPASFDITLVDMQGRKTVLGTVPGVVAPRVSPDGTRIAYEMADPAAATGPQTVQLYVAQLNKFEQKKALQFTLTTTRNLYPVWSSDSDWVAFVATGNGSDSIFWQRADGYIQPKYLLDGRAPERMYDTGLMGTLGVVTLKGDKDYGISLLDLNTRKVTRVDQPGSAQYGGAVSRDGNWIAFTSDESGRPEIWLQSLQQESTRVQLTRDGGSHPQWSADGSQLYFDQGGKLFRINVKLDGKAPKASGMTALPISGFQQTEVIVRQYDLTPDGKNFLMLFPATAKK